MFNRLRLINRFNSVLANTTATNTTSSHTLRSMMINSTAASFHVDIKNNHFVMTEEKRVFLEALKVELFASRSNVANMINENTRSYSTQVASTEVEGFDKSLENSRNLMCHKRHDVLTQQESEYFLYL